MGMLVESIHIGDRFQRWVVESEPRKVSGVFKCRCRCDCGTVRDVFAYDLLHGKSVSCGCLRTEMVKRSNTKHGHSKERLYVVWKGIRGRCTDESHISYKYYGGKGISMCKEWDDYENFRSWALQNGYKKGLSIDRIDSNGDYEPGNCRWATVTEQNNNSSHNRIVVIDGIGMSKAAAARKYGIKIGTVNKRMEKGWDIVKAITEPVRDWGRCHKDG